MIFAFYFSTLFFGLAASRFLRLPLLSLGLGYSAAFCALFGSLFFTHDIAVSGYWTTGLLLTLAGALWTRTARTPVPFKAHRPFLVYLAAYALLLVWQGAYVEIPSDAVGVHLFRIGTWLRERYIALGVENNGLFSSTLFEAYVFNAAAFALSPFRRDTTIEIVSFFNSLYLAAAFYGCAYFFLRKSSQAVFALIAAQCILGINVYSYFRYYTFGPTLFNMVAVFDAFCLFYSLKTAPKKAAPWVVLALFAATCWLTHKQEAVFLFTIAVFTFGYFALPWTGASHRRLFLWLASGLACVGLAGAATGAWLGKIEIPQGPLLGGFIQWFKWGKLTVVCAHPLGWHVRTTLSTAWLIALVLVWRWALTGLRDRPRSWLKEPASYLFLFSQVPLLMVFFPPLATFYSLFFYNIVFYRILYFTTAFFCLPLAVVDIWHGTMGWRRRVWAAGLGLMVVCAFWGPNERGRHFLAQSRSEESYGPWLPVYDRLAQFQIPTSKKNPGGISIYTDPVTAYPMNFLAGATTPTCYFWRCDFPGQTWTTETTQAGFENYLGTCDYFLYNRTSGYVPSRFAGHWPPEIRAVTPYYDARVPLWIEQLLREKKMSLVFKQDQFEFYRIDFSK